MINGKIERKYYKVVTADMKSLGLARNPTIYTYKLGEVYKMKDEELKADNGHSGGIWLAPSRSSAKQIVEYMAEKHETYTRVFEVEIGRILYENSYRLKTESVRFLMEIYYIFKLENRKLQFVD